jgi:hypothetical protein
MRRLSRKIEEQSSLTNMEFLVLRPTQSKHSSVTLTDMLECTLEMALKVNEYIDIKDSVEEQQYKDAENQSNKPGSKRP